MGLYILSAGVASGLWALKDLLYFYYMGEGFSKWFNTNLKTLIWRGDILLYYDADETNLDNDVIVFFLFFLF